MCLADGRLTADGYEVQPPGSDDHDRNDVAATTPITGEPGHAA